MLWQEVLVVRHCRTKQVRPRRFALCDLGIARHQDRDPLQMQVPELHRVDLPARQQKLLISQTSIIDTAGQVSRTARKRGGQGVQWVSLEPISARLVYGHALAQAE